MKFFEPDVLVEAETGLAESIGYGALAEDRYESQLLGLDDLHSSEGERRPKLRFGLSILDAYRTIYETRRQFVLRDKRPSFIFNETRLAPIVEAVFGAFPKEEDASYFKENYIGVFEPVEADVDVKHWFEIFRDGATIPFHATNHQIEIAPRGGQDLSFVVFDHTKPADLIDYWNKRLFEAPVYPVPLRWFGELAETMVEMITNNYRPIPNNPHGTKFTSSVYFGRSINQEHIVELIRAHLESCPDHSYHVGGTWHPKVPTGRRGPICERHEHEVSSADFDTSYDDGSSVTFETLAPDFAERYGGGNHRWVNVVNLSCYESDTLALTYPSNLEDRTTPRIFRSLNERPIISREGWVLSQHFKGIKGYLELSDGASAIGDWLGRKGIKAELSNAGRIAKQMIENLGSLWGTHIIADEETIRLLDSMAMQEEVSGAADDATRRQYQGRTVDAGRWKTLTERIAKDRLPRLSLERFAECGILKLGLEVNCHHCSYANWYGLDQIDYDLVCDRCLKPFRFPQGGARIPWKYRVTGPFSLPNFAEGAYTVALTLRTFKMNLAAGPEVEMTYATGLNLKNVDFNREVDFAFWYGKSRSFGQRTEPSFIVGEAKSFAEEAIAERDIESLKLVAQAIPGTVLVVSVLKKSFSETDRTYLSDLARWGWERVNGRMRSHVVLLTGVELFADFGIRQAWNKAGEHYPKNADYHTFNDLNEFAYATQKIHLGLDYYAERETNRLKKKSTKK